MTKDRWPPPAPIKPDLSYPADCRHPSERHVSGATYIERECPECKPKPPPSTQIMNTFEPSYNPFVIITGWFKKIAKEWNGHCDQRIKDMEEKVYGLPIVSSCAPMPKCKPPKCDCKFDHGYFLRCRPCNDYMLQELARMDLGYIKPVHASERRTNYNHC